MQPHRSGDDSFRDRAIAFAAGAGSVVLILALLATDVGGKLQAENPVVRALAVQALLLSVIAAAVTAAATLRALEPIARALDAIARVLRNATAGELYAEFTREARGVLPVLVDSLEVLMSRVRASLESARADALNDPVTGLPNRVHFRRIVEQRLSELRDGEEAALLFIDLDRFKAVNDSLGHAQGDVLLKAFADRIRGIGEGRHDAILARLAGDEFTLFIPKVDGPATVERLARLGLRKLAEPFQLADRQVVIGASVGIARYPADGGDYDTLMRHADTAMYHAKDLGRNRAEFYNSAMHERLRDRLSLEIQLRDALIRHEFELFFQPLVDARTGTTIAAEALLRWRHPLEGLRGPATFVPVAEESELIVDIGRWVIAEAVRTAARWARQGRPLRISLNISPRQLGQPDLVPFIRGCIAAENAPADLIELEITESFVSSGVKALETIEALRALGLSIAIDDFGTGYSNLARLKRLPVDRLKIDRSLISDVLTTADARTIVQAIIGLAHGLGYEVIAEGVETKAQADLLALMGCESLQGYAFAPALEERLFNVARDRQAPAMLRHTA